MKFPYYPTEEFPYYTKEIKIKSSKEIPLKRLSFSSKLSYYHKIFKKKFLKW